jgi:hypothetical protein
MDDISGDLRNVMTPFITKSRKDESTKKNRFRVFVIDFIFLVFHLIAVYPVQASRSARLYDDPGDRAR